MSAYLIASIVALLGALACYAFISQAIERRRIQKQRILMALKTKHRNFEFMLNGLPQNFLPPDLMSLALRELIHICEQLAEVDKNDPKHHNNIANYSAQLTGLPKTNQTARVKLENPAQIREIHQHLVEIQRFVIQQATVKKITRAQMDAHVEQIKSLALQLSVDAYLSQAKDAQGNGKIRLAVHYYNLAKKLFESENETHQYDKQIQQLAAAVLKLEEKAKELGVIAPTVDTATPTPTSSKEWDKIKSPKDESWKKKSVYD